MRAKRLEILVEEPSIEALLRKILPSILGTTTDFQIYPYRFITSAAQHLPPYESKTKTPYYLSSQL